MYNTMMFSRNNPFAPTPETSEFYNACWNGNIPLVKYILLNMTVNDINKFEPNGNTALHAACYRNHVGLVDLLQRQGAQGSIKNSNGLGLTPSEVTTNTYIKYLLSRTGNRAWMEWTFANPPSREVKQLFNIRLENTFNYLGLAFILDYVLNHYVRGPVAKRPNVDIFEIEQCFIEARKLNGARLSPVIYAYTADYRFDQSINHDCIDILPELVREDAQPTNPLSASIFYLIASFNYDPTLRPRYTFTGRVYRGIRTSIDYLRTYKKGEIIVNSPFLSTSKEQSVADGGFAGIGATKRTHQKSASGTFLEASVRFTYDIRRRETRAMDIEGQAKIPDEKEVLIMPLSVFRVIEITHNEDESEYYIHLEDCDLPSKDDPLAPIIRLDIGEIPKLFPLPIVLPISSPPSNPIDRFSFRSADWPRQLATNILNMSTNAIIITIVVMVLIFLLILLAILLPLLLYSTNNMQTRQLFLNPSTI